MPKLRDGVASLEALKVRIDSTITSAVAEVPGKASTILAPIAVVAPLRAAADALIAASTKTRGRVDLDRRLAAANSGIAASMETVTALIEATNGILALEELQAYVTAEIARAAAQEAHQNYEAANEILNAIAAHVTAAKDTALALISTNEAKRSVGYNASLATRKEQIQDEIERLLSPIPAKIAANVTAADMLAELESRTRVLTAAATGTVRAVAAFRRTRTAAASDGAGTAVEADAHPAPALEADHAPTDEEGGAADVPTAPALEAGSAATDGAGAVEGADEHPAPAQMEAGDGPTASIPIAAGTALAGGLGDNHADGDPAPPAADHEPLNRTVEAVNLQVDPMERRYQEALASCRQRLGAHNRQGITIAVVDARRAEVGVKLRQLLEEVNRLKISGHPLKELTEVLETTLARISGSTDMDAPTYATKANEMHGLPRLGSKILGVMMIALGAAILAAGIALPILFPPLVYVGSMVAAVGVGVGSSGFCFFGRGMASSNYKAAHALNDAMTKAGITQFSADEEAAHSSPTPA